MDKSKRTFRLPVGRAACITYLNTLPAEPEMEVIVRPYKRNISEAQRALMWIWHKQWSEHFGDSPQEQHINFKRDYVLPILFREVAFPGLAGVYRAVIYRRDVGDFGPLEAFYRMLSTSWLNTAQMREALTQYEMETAERGLAFITQGPEYEDAMR